MIKSILYTAVLVFCALIANAQMDTQLRQIAEDYFIKNPEERLYLHLAKSDVLAGEQLWFRIYHYSPINNQPFSFSKVAYVELLDDEGNHVVGERIKMDSSGGGGYLSVPATIDAGNYHIRAYTRWMQNFNQKAFFSTQIRVINTFKPLGLKSPVDSSRVSVSFMPEGGDLVAGSTAVVGMLMLDGQGKGIPVSGSVLDRDSSEVAFFQTNEFGIDSFSFTPVAGQSYQAVIRIDSSNVVRYSLPAIRPGGISMRTERISDGYRIHVLENGVVPGRRYVAGISRGEFMFMKSASSGGGPVVFTVSDEELKEGINQLTVFTNEGVPVCERLIYREPAGNLKISIEISSPSLHSRENATVKVHTTDEDGTAVEADLSVSVFPVGGNLDSEPLNFATYMWLTADVSLPKSLVSAFDPQRPESLDINEVLLVYGWRRYDWEAMNAEREIAYIPEFRDPLLTGKLQNTENTEGIVYFGYPDSLSNIFTARAASDGSFLMETPNYFGKKDIVLRYDKPEIPGLNLTPLFHEDHAVPSADYFYFGPENASFLRELSENLQVENVFYPHGKTVSDFENFYGEPSASFSLDDYTRFPVMEEVMREYVYGVYVRKRDGKFYFRILDESRNDTMNEDPLILLDGIPVFSADEIMQLNPVRIRKIDVYRGKYGIGPVMASGIVAFYSYNTDMAGYSLPESSLKQTYQGLQRYKEFYSPEHNDDFPARLPDFRTQLFWTPQLITTQGEASVSFYTSDVTGTYMINVQGMGSNGYSGAETITFTID